MPPRLCSASPTSPSAVLDELLEDRGAQIEGGASSDVVSMGFRCLSEDSREVLGIFADVVQRPALPKDKLQLYQAQVRISHGHVPARTRSSCVRVCACVVGRVRVRARLRVLCTCTHLCVGGRGARRGDLCPRVALQQGNCRRHLLCDGA